MRMKCENIVTCGNYKCELNYDGTCCRTVVALDGDGKCVMCKPKRNPTSPDCGTNVNAKVNKPYDIEASK